MPRINMLLLTGVLVLLALFRSSSALAGAYGIAVTGTMVTTAVLAILFIAKNGMRTNESPDVIVMSKDRVTGSNAQTGIWSFLAMLLFIGLLVAIFPR